MTKQLTHKITGLVALAVFAPLFWEVIKLAVTFTAVAR